MTNRINSVRAANRIVVDSYTGEWQPALCPRRTPEIGDVVALAEDGDAREWDDFRNALSAAGACVRMCGRKDRAGRDLGVVDAGREDGELIVW